MALTVAWNNPKQTAIRIVSEGEWTWREYYVMANEVMDLLDCATHRVNIIADFRTPYLPPGAFSQLENATAFLRHSRAGYGVLIGVRGMIRTLVIIFCQLYPERAQSLLFAATVEEAEKLLARRSSPVSVSGSSGNTCAYRLYLASM